MELSELGSVLRERREAIGISKAEIARRVEVSESYVGMVERGKRRPSKPVLEPWAAALGWDENYTRQLLALAGHVTKEDTSIPSTRSPSLTAVLHFPQPRRMEKERVIQEVLEVLNKAEVSKEAWQESLKLLGSFLGWLNFRLEEALSFAQRLYLHITGPASEVQSFFDEVEAGKHDDLKVARAPREYTNMFARRTLGYEARLYGAIEFTAPVAEKLAHDYVKRLIEKRFSQSRIEVKVSKDAPSP